MPKAISIIAARAAKDRAKRELAKLPGLVGLGLTKQGDGYAVKVNLHHALAEGSVPPSLLGVPVVVEVVGDISAR